MSLTPLPPFPQESAPLAHIFCLTVHEWSFPAVVKFRENTALKMCLNTAFLATFLIGSLVGFLELVFYSAKTYNLVAWIMMTQIVCFGHVSGPPLLQALQLIPRVLCLYCSSVRQQEKVLDNEMQYFTYWSFAQ